MPRLLRVSAPNVLKDSTWTARLQGGGGKETHSAPRFLENVVMWRKEAYSTARELDLKKSGTSAGSGEGGAHLELLQWHLYLLFLWYWYICYTTQPFFSKLLLGEKRAHLFRQNDDSTISTENSYHSLLLPLPLPPLQATTTTSCSQQLEHEFLQFC